MRIRQTMYSKNMLRLTAIPAVLAIVVLGLGPYGCSRQPSDGLGSVYRSSVAAQILYPERGDDSPVEGLDGIRAAAAVQKSQDGPGGKNSQAGDSGKATGNGWSTQSTNK